MPSKKTSFVAMNQTADKNLGGSPLEYTPVAANQRGLTSPITSERRPAPPEQQKRGRHFPSDVYNHKFLKPSGNSAILMMLF
jgi:hypothetical protein